MLYLFKPSGIIPGEYKKFAEKVKTKRDRLFRVYDENDEECYTFLLSENPRNTIQGIYVQVKDKDEAFQEVISEYPYCRVEEVM